jgi:hypothetical protein
MTDPLDALENAMRDAEARWLSARPGDLDSGSHEGSRRDPHDTMVPVWAIRIVRVTGPSAEALRDGCASAMETVRAARRQEPLPERFLAACSPDLSPLEEESELRAIRRMASETDHAHEAARPWTPSGWLYWLEDENRTWYWIAAHLDGASMEVQLACPDLNAPHGAFNWLMRASGLEPSSQG